uniref:Uncharacterized protein n=1 Tax=Tanacetum cinerariifolium TaxID=118510 RepID=A0A699IW29_TANCI|nr:hypothetical protein [Tanacetum cinerariifolium]
MKIQKKSLLSTSQQDLLVQCCHLLVLLVWEQYCLGVIYGDSNIRSWKVCMMLIAQLCASSSSNSGG